MPGMGRLGLGLGLGGRVLPSAEVSEPPADPYFGSELVTNGGFDADTDWTLSNDNGVSPTISTGKLRGHGDETKNGSATQVVTFSQGTIYRASFDLDSISTASGVDLFVGSVGHGLTERTAAGTQAGYIIAGAPGVVDLTLTLAYTDAVVDNVSLKEVLDQTQRGAELHAQPAFSAITGLTRTNCTVTGGKLLFEAPGITSRCRCTSAEVLIDGDIIAWSLDVDSTDGSMQLFIGGTAVTDENFNTPGTKSGLIRTNATNQFLDITAVGGEVTAIIDNISVKKVTLPAL